MNEVVRLTRDIHYFVRGELNWDESLQLLVEIADSQEWLDFLETDMLLYQMGLNKQEPKSSDLQFLP